jgi:hypothetical protein
VIETESHYLSEWTLVFRNVDPTKMTSPLWRLLRPGFQHVECWREDRGVWIQLDPGFELVSTAVHEHAPEQLEWLPWAKPTFFKVMFPAPKHRLRAPFFVGPLTCVEYVKAAIGVPGAFVRTPYQLFKKVQQWPAAVVAE